MKTKISYDPQLIADCLRQQAAGHTDMEVYLRSKGIAEQVIPGIISELRRISDDRKTAKSRMMEGGVVTTLGLCGVAYATAKEKDGTAWLIWSVVGLGILANGWWKRKKINSTIKNQS